MASRWVKSFQCKSKAFDDVFNPAPKHLIASSSCRKSTQSIKDVIEAATTNHHKHRHTKPKHHHYRELQQQKPNSNCSKSTKPTPDPVHPPASRSRSLRNPDPQPVFPALTELPEGHPSRNIVEIIFHTSWGNKSFPVRIDMIFKVQNGPKTVVRFEEYCELVKTRAGLSGGSTRKDNARCFADGNEMMRFYCLGPAGGVQDACGGAWVFQGGKGAAVCTFSGSGAAHESAGGGRGRKAMLVCRVIAGRVSKEKGLDSVLDGSLGFDSVSGDNGELLVFDPRAVLACFLVIYKL